MLLNKKRMRKHRKKKVNRIKMGNRNQRKIRRKIKTNNQKKINQNKKVVQMKITQISLLWETVETPG
jgi:hypothetical protein